MNGNRPQAAAEAAAFGNAAVEGAEVQLQLQVAPVPGRSLACLCQFIDSLPEHY